MSSVSEYPNLRQCKIMNKLKASTNKKNTLIITDWDDTIWFTYFLRYSDIDISDIDTRKEYEKLFRLFDNKLAETILKLKEHGDLVVCTNAKMPWIDLCLSISPKTKIALSNVPIHSARDEFENVSGMSKWKTHSFKLIVDNAGRRGKKYTNIVSLGDADYEHNALVNLYTCNSTSLKNCKYLKSIKFEKTYDLDKFLTQIDNIQDNINAICTSERHLDMEFILN